MYFIALKTVTVLLKKNRLAFANRLVIERDLFFIQITLRYLSNVLLCHSKKLALWNLPGFLLLF